MEKNRSFDASGLVTRCCREGTFQQIILFSLLVFSSVMFSVTALAQGLPGPGDGGGGGFGGGVNTQLPEPIIDWQKKQDETGRLSALSMGLMGDRIEPHTGGLSFEHTDVVLPGNSSLDVSIRRRIQTGALYKSNVKAEFGDWELIVPRIKVITSSQSYYRLGARCSAHNPLQMISVPYPKVVSSSTGTGTVQMNRNTYSNEYSNGYSLDVPGYGQQAMRKSAGALGESAPFFTHSGWKIDCLSNITGGGQGYEATAPDGTVYRFDRFYELEAPRLGFLGHTSSAFDRYASIVAASLVTDVHGNTVEYDYDSSNRLTKIEASDGRVITLSYTGGTDMISRVTANGRHWDYSYGTNSLTYWARFLHNTFSNSIAPVGPYPTLTSVTQPDGLSWTLDMEAMSAEVPPALSCEVETFTVTVNHPHGMQGEFTIMPLKHKVTGTTLSPKPKNVAPGYCPNPEANTANQYLGSGDQPTGQYYAPVWMMSNTYKKLTGSNVPTMEWRYDYELSNSLWGPNDDQLNRTDIVQPDGTIERYFHGWGTEPVIGNQLVKKQIVDGGTILREENYTNIMENWFGWDGLSGGQLSFLSAYPRRVEKSVLSQDGDTFTTEFQYNLDRTSAFYSFGNPTQKKFYSNVSTAPRIFDFTYEHKPVAWILNLPKKTVLNGRELIDHVYNADGLKTSQSRYGQAGYFTFTYASDGTPFQATDALGLIAQATSWYRGTPQIIKKAFGSTDEITIAQTVDDNGWVTAATDPMLRTTTYSRDDMGRLTQVVPHGAWDNTDIVYDFSSPGAVQTITKGQSEQTITYDAMLRPTLEHSQDLSTTWESYVNMTYNNLGQMTFKSQPSLSATETKGMNTTYDALGRVYTEAETVAPFATTTHSYQSGHKFRVTDPSGAWKEYTSHGYGGPGSKDYKEINENNLRLTTINKDTYGQTISVVQSGSQGGVLVSAIQEFFYNATDHRLCGYRGVEGGSTRYQYDAAGQMVAYAEGMTTDSSCPLPSGVSKVNMTYDDLGRITHTDFADATDVPTPDITRTYDDNGNVLTVERGTGADAVNWAYGYNDADLLTSEILTVDTRSYAIGYLYNSAGHLLRRDNPDGFHTDFLPDGLGRATGAKYNTTNYASNASYHASGTLTDFAYGNGFNYTKTLNARLLPSRLHALGGGETTLDLNYTYDARAKVTAMTDGAVSGNNRSFGYDALGQMTSSTGPWGNMTASYDSLGNMLSRNLGSRTITLNYDGAKNRVNQSLDSLAPASGGTGTRTVDYDSRGNVTTLGTLGMVYDYSDQPIAVSGTANGVGSANGTYMYDGNLKRIKSTVNGRTIYNIYSRSGELVHIDERPYTNAQGQQVAEKRTDYVKLGGMSVARVENKSDVVYIFSDHLGSPVATKRGTDAIKRERYTPFGIAMDDNPDLTNQAGFTGHIKDAATGLNYMQARYYDPVIGRFLSIDPVKFMMNGNPSYFNRYAYTSNDPVNRIDPFGMASVCVSSTDSRTKSCVSVDGNGDGNTKDNDLTRSQKNSFSKAFGSYIMNNNGADLSGSGARSVSGFNDTIASNIRVTSQFVGHASDGALSNVHIRFLSSKSSRANTEGGSVLYNRDGTIKAHRQFINFSPRAHGDSFNPSDYARTLFHEIEHQYGRGPGSKGYYIGGGASNPLHMEIDNTARANLKRHGLDGMGCTAFGGTTIFGHTFGGYPGC